MKNAEWVTAFFFLAFFLVSSGSGICCSGRCCTTGRRSSPCTGASFCSFCIQGRRSVPGCPVVFEKTWSASLPSRIRIINLMPEGSVIKTVRDRLFSPLPHGYDRDVPRQRIPHISRAYSLMLRSLENLPMPATLQIARLVHSSLSRKMRAALSWTRR